MTFTGQRDVRRHLEKRSASRPYASSQAAVEDAARVALLVAVPQAQRSRQFIRQQAITELNAAREGSLRERAATVGGPQVPGTLQKVLVVVALLLALAGPALVLGVAGGRRNAFDVQDGALWTGLLELASVALFAWLARFRHGSPGRSVTDVPSRLYLFFGILWLGLVALILLFRRGEIDMYEPLLPFLGIALMVLAGIGALLLWRRERAVDKRLGLHGVDSGARLVVDDDQPALWRALDDWWRAAPTWLTPEEKSDVSAAFASALAVLHEKGAISSAEAAGAGAVPPWSIWREDRA
ncbi:hypothetical protein [Microbacterium sp. CFBP9034]|uniref:hypothetical protein n=1 Tax=Microbacterium sp. CFBP9034 TaxID=3096540 RepID=UPI002A6B8E3C|nr:hypothetical protein [Microbacterium sp. CFBP9034]MDY0910326.1 hypothetical protein [Microbacterium sp. CFBP9034]